MKKRKTTWQKVMGIYGMLLLTLMPVKTLGAETAYATYYEDGTETPVIQSVEYGSKILYANGTSLIFKDGEMYQDFAPFGEWNNTDRRIYLSEDRSSEALDRLHVNTGGTDDTVYGDCYMTFLNTDMIGLYVNHITDVTVYMNNSKVTGHYIENADGDVNYTIKNVTDFNGIKLYDTDLESEDKDGGLIKGSLNITLENVKGADVKGSDGVIETSGTVLGDTRVTIKNCLLGHIEPARIVGSETQKANVSVYVENSDLESLSIVTRGEFGSSGTIYGDVDVFVKDSNIELGIDKYATKIQAGKYNKVIGKSTLRVEDSVVQTINDTDGNFVADSISESTSLILKNVEVNDLVTNSVNLEGTVKCARFMVNDLKFANNAVLISDISSGSAYIHNQVSGTGTIKANVARMSQNFYFDGANPIAKNTKIAIVPVRLTDGVYVTCEKNTVLGRAIGFYFQKNTKSTSYLNHFTCANYGVNEIIGEGRSEVIVLEYCKSHNYKIAKTSGYAKYKYHASLYDKEATCTKEGLKTYYCTYCDKMKYEKTKALGHDCQKSKVVKPTLKAKGYTLFECTRCNYSYKGNYVAALKSIKDAKVTLSTTKYTYNGKAKTPKVTVKLGKTTLKKNTDYTVSYKNNKNVGKATVTINGKGKYGGTLSKTYTINAKKGTTFTYGAYKYKITSASAVSFTGIKSTKTTKVEIPKTVKYGGATFKVTSIADKALKNKEKVTKVTIGSNVKTIGKEAFYGCKKLKNITIKSTGLKTVGKQSLKGIHSKAKVYVPKSKVKTYKSLLKGKGQVKTVKIVAN